MVYVMADIHGMQDYFDDVLEQIQLREEDTLYILGDVVDRGPDGIPLLLRTNYNAAAAYKNIAKRLQGQRVSLLRIR